MMTNHLSKRQLNAYLDSELSQSENRAAWQHLRECQRCYALLQREQRLRTELKQELSVLGRTRRDDLKTMLPGILAEVRRPAQMGLNKMAVMLAILLMLVMLLPILPLLKVPVLAMSEPLFNVPTQTQTFEPADQETREAHPSSALQNTFNVEYASPAPLPQVTADASVEPHLGN